MDTKTSHMERKLALLSICVRCIIITLLIIPPFTVSAQLRIGDKIPDVYLSNVVNYHDSAFHFHDIKKKLIIIDFWGTGCMGCIEGLPELGRLQERFGDKIQILAVNKQSKDSTLRFFSSHKRVKMPPIPFVMGDTALENCFPHVLNPLVIWVDSNFVVRQMTSGYNTRDYNIEKYLKGKALHFLTFSYVKKTVIDTFLDRELVSGTNYYSIITHYSPSIQMFTGLVSTEGKMGEPNAIQVGFSSIIRLFVTAFSEHGKYNIAPRGCWLLRGIDTSIFFHPSETSSMDYYLSHNYYGYCLKVPEDEWRSLFPFMQHDLERYFHVRAKVVKRSLPCYVLVKREKDDKAIQAGMKRIVGSYHGERPDSVSFVRNEPMKDFVAIMQGIFLAHHIPLPLIDETDYTGKVQMVLRNKPFRSFNMKMIREEMQKYGFDIIKRRRRTDALVIAKDKK